MDREPSAPALTALERTLRVRISVANGWIARVDLDGRRPIQAARVLEGRAVESALETLPLLYRLCGTAQSVAGLRAVEAAIGCATGASSRSGRSLLVACEALEQSLWRILLDWPRCIGRPADELALARLRKRIAALARDVFADAHWARIGGARVNGSAKALAQAADSLSEEVESALFGDVRPEDVLDRRTHFEAWCRGTSSSTAAVFEWVARHGLERFGGEGIRPADDFDAAYIGERLGGDDGWQFCSRPDHHGEVPQTGALARLASASLVRELSAEHGYGLATQLAARLLEVPTLLGEIRDQIAGLSPEEAAEPPCAATGCALGAVDTARGRLFHWVDVRDGQIARYRILAPTEWNFHPRGPLAEGLTGAPARVLALTRRAAELLVTAIDPCVGVQLAIAEA